MRLLNTTTLQLQDFFDADIPKYTILSHTWDPDECTLQSFSETRHAEKKAAGVVKVLEFCETVKSAYSSGHNWVWADTCCIDKTSSSELSEAINSMYRWYQQGQRCVVYLSDVSLDGGLDDEVFSSSLESLVGTSRYFTRGWTLQELLAPREVDFYDRHWKFFGTKSSLLSLLSKITTIAIRYLENPDGIIEASVACRMSWAAYRETSRLEDRAYSLLGIFDINMPLIYGEGSKAFERLCKEIINTIDDESVFAWSRTTRAWPARPFAGMLAASPLDYAASGAFHPVVCVTRPPATVTSRGVLLHILGTLPDTTTFQLKLNCSANPISVVSIEVFRYTESNGSSTFYRSDSLSELSQPRSLLFGEATQAATPLYLAIKYYRPEWWKQGIRP